MLLPLLLSTVALAQEAPPRVLHLGNSYTFFHDLQLRVAEALQATVPAYAVVEGARLAGGGLRLPDHVDRVEAGEAQWVDALTGEPGRWTWMVLQDQSQIPGFPESEPYWQYSADAVTTLDGYAVDQDAETVLFMTWGRRDGDSTNPSMFPDFETMNARLDAGYQSYATRASEPGRTIWIAPVGRAFAAVYSRLVAAGTTPEDAGTDFHRLYDGDGSHPSPLGTALSAAVFVRTFTGWSPRWDSTPPGVDAADVDWLIAAADAAVVPFGDLAYPWAHPFSDYTAPSDLDPTLGWVVSGDTLCTTVGIDDATEALGTATLGILHDGTPGCGRLWVADGGSLTVGSVGTEAGATGEVVVAGGSLDVSSLGTPASVQGGALVVSGSATAAVALSAGTLAWASSSSGISLSMSGGTLQVEAGAGPVFSDAVALAGTLEVTGTVEDSVVLLSAASVVLDGDLEHNLPDGWTLEVQAADSVDSLWAVAPGDSGEGGGDDGGAVDEGTAGETTSGGGDGGGDDADDDGGADPSETSGSPSETDKSGCAIVGGATGGLAFALLAVAARRRD